jgi:MFS family permease
MSQEIFVLILICAGFLAGISWAMLNNACFAAIKRWLAGRGGFNRSIGIVDLIGYLLGVLVSCGYLLIIIIGVTWWTNHHPEWRSSKDIFWLGVIGGAVVLRIFRKSDR